MTEPPRDPKDRSADAKMQMITPLLLPGMDKGALIRAKKEIVDREGISYRTVGRYLAAWETSGYEGLKPKPPWNKGKTDIVANMDAVVTEAIVLRTECPERSVRDIIRIMEMEGKIPTGSIRRTTLQDHLFRAGYSAKQVRRVKESGEASRRFQKAHRCEMWQSDIKYGPYLPIGENGKMEQVFLCVFLDDCTRFIVSAAFYEKQDAAMVEDCFRQAVMRYGKPDALYVDNGKQYGKWLSGACKKLGTVLLHTQPYDPEAKGKVEAFNHRINAFLSEIALERPKTLEALNQHLESWINEYYHKNEHRALGGISPKTAFAMDQRPLSFPDIQVVREAFLHKVERVADKTGCVSFNGKLFEAGMQFAGRKVEVVYDPCCKDEIEVRRLGCAPVTARTVAIGPYCGKAHKQDVGADRCATFPKGSRMLTALNKANITHRTHSGIATSFRIARTPEDKNHV